MAEMSLFDTMYSARALRRYKTDPIPDDVMTKILQAATQAPSGSNQQNWVFMVVKDAAKKKKISDIYARGAQILTAVYANRPRPPHMDEKQFQTLMNSAMYLFDHMHEAPVLLFACLRTEATGPVPNLPPEIAAAGGQDGAYRWIEHLSRSAEHHPGVSRIRHRHRADHPARFLRG